MSHNIVTKELWDFGMSQLENEKDWIVRFEREDIKVWTKQLYPEEDLPTQKVVATFPFPLKYVYKCFKDLDNRCKWNNALVEAKTIVCGDGVICRAYKEVEGGVDVIMKETTHPDWPLRDGVVRAGLKMCAMKYRVNPKNSNWTDMFQINQASANGWIPGVLIPSLIT